MSQTGPAEKSGASLFMLGLDAVSLPFIQDHLDRLPTLASLLQRGRLQHLQSSATYLSASVWPTFYTGKQPGEHGQYFPFQWNGEHCHYRRIADPRWSDDFYLEPFWHRIAKAGVPTIAFDIAHVLHDERAPCLQITNWSYQSSGDAKSSQPEVLREIQRRFGKRPIGPEVPVPKSARQCDAIRDQLVSAVKAKAEATLYLMERPWTLFVTGWYEPHRAGHNLWPVDGDFASDASPDAMLAVYEEADRQLGRVLSRLGAETSVLVFSLHGMEPNRAQDHFLTEIMSRLNKLYLGQESRASKRPSYLNVMALLRRALPATLQYRTASLLGERVQDWVVNRALTAGREWVGTLSLPALSGGEGLIRLNIKGRESPGYFRPGSAELTDYVNWLKARLSEIRVVGTREPLIKRITDIDEKYPGDRRAFLPDLMIEWAPDAPADRISSPAIGEIEVSLATGRGGNHNDKAFIIATGDDELVRMVSDIGDISEIGGVAERFLSRTPELVG